MARWNYFNRGTKYSEWHRRHENIGMIDIDSVECCINKGCWQPLAIIETVYDIGKYYKTTTIVETIAKALNIPCFLVFYKEGVGVGRMEFKIQRLLPFKSDLEVVLEGDYVGVLRSLHEEHEKVCKYAKK